MAEEPQATPAPERDPGFGSTPEGPVGAPATPTEIAWDDIINTAPEDLRQDAVFADYKSMEGLMKSHKHLQSMVGLDKIAVPNENSSQEVWDEALTRMGRPQAAEDYSLDYEMDGVALNKEQVELYRGWAHELGLSQKQAHELQQKFNKGQVEQQRVYDQEQSATMLKNTEVLQQKYGNALEQKRLVASEAARARSSNEQEFQKWSMMANDPDVFGLLVDLAEANGEATLKGGSTPAGISTPNELMQQINKIEADPAFMNIDDPRHKALMAEKSSLYKLAYPEGD